MSALKPRGWCEKQNIEHAWEAGPMLCSDPPKATRHCKNCGRQQIFVPGHWERYADPETEAAE